MTITFPFLLSPASRIEEIFCPEYAEYILQSQLIIVDNFIMVDSSGVVWSETELLASHLSEQIHSWVKSTAALFLHPSMISFALEGVRSSARSKSFLDGAKEPAVAADLGEKVPQISHSLHTLLDLLFDTALFYWLHCSGYIYPPWIFLNPKTIHCRGHHQWYKKFKFQIRFEM